MNEPCWKVRARWTLADGSESNGLVFLEEQQPVPHWRALRSALGWFAIGPNGPREFQSITLTIEESPRCEPYTSG